MIVKYNLQTKYNLQVNLSLKYLNNDHITKT